MDFQILGPLAVLDEGSRITLGGAKQRALLAALLLNANETVSTDRLIEELWREDPPATAAKTLQVHVSRLRKALAQRDPAGTAGPLLTRDHGYELSVDPEAIDARRFERLVREGGAQLADGSAAAAAATLTSALSLWHGDALADVAYEPFAQGEGARLEALRVAAREQLIDARLVLGAHAELVPEIEALIRAHPYRERLRGQLMIALYRCDRQADALQAYHDARGALVEGLGIEPGEHLRDLERAILEQDPALGRQEVGAPGSSVRATNARGIFVGRERELAALRSGLEHALAGRGRLFLLAGEPGIGKSRLTEEIVAAAGERGARTLVGRCWEAGGAPAYWPWVQSLRAYVRDADPAQLAGLLDARAQELTQLLPELQARAPAPPAPVAQDPQGARFRLFDATSAFLIAAARARPLVLVLDDLHAADEPSLLLLRFVARELGSAPLLVVCAYRDVDPALSPALSDTVAELLREPHTVQLQLGGLRERDVARYLELSRQAAAAPALVRAIQAETDGNPLFVTEFVRLLEAEDVGAADLGAHIPPGVRAVIERRLRRLSGPCRRAITAAAVLGREFDVHVLAELTELGPAELLETLDEAVTERVVVDAPGSRAQLRFAHVLIRDICYDALTPARAVELHRRAGEAVERLHAADLQAHLAELVHHFVAAAPAGSAGTAVEYARRAGALAATQLAYEEAIRLYRVGLSLVDDDTRCCELLLALGDAQARAGEKAAAQASLERAAELAERLGRPELQAQAALGYGGRLVWDVSRDDARTRILMERALAALPRDDSPLRVRLLARLAGGPLRDASFPPSVRRPLADEALEMARRLGDPATLAYALSGFMAARQSPQDTQIRLKLATELVAVALEAGERERAVEAYEHRLTARLELGDIHGAKADFTRMKKLARELRQPAHDWFAAIYAANFALLEGRLAEAEEHIEAARAAGERAMSWSAEVTYRLQLYVLRREQRRLAEIEDMLRRAAGDYPTYPIWSCVLAQAAAELGHEHEARTTLLELTSGRCERLPLDETWLASVYLLAEAATALHEREAASVLYELLLPYSERVALSYPEFSLGAVARPLGLLAMTCGERERAENHLSAAIALNERIGARPALARAREELAALVAAGPPASSRPTPL